MPPAALETALRRPKRRKPVPRLHKALHILAQLRVRLRHPPLRIHPPSINLPLRPTRNQEPRTRNTLPRFHAAPPFFFFTLHKLARSCSSSISSAPRSLAGTFQFAGGHWSRLNSAKVMRLLSRRPGM